MKKIIVAALFILAAGAAQAQGTRFYIGADVAKVTTNVEDKTGIPPIVSGEADATTLRLKGGAHFTSWFDLELQLLFPSEETYSRVATNNTVKSSVFAIFAKPKAAFGPLEVYGLIGVAGTTIEMTGVFQGKKSKSDIAYGVGAQYNFTPNLGASLEFTQYNKANFELENLPGGIDIDLKAVSVGIAYTF
jgi:opacity protein-like surface antigen